MTLDEIIECIKEVKEDYWEDDGYGYATADCQRITTALDEVIERLEQTRWIPVSERVPEDTYPVNITWVNHAPVPYYATIKDKPFTATGCYCDGKWYWYSVTCQDYLDEYRYCDVDSMDEEIEVIAWMPLPEPFEP